MPLPTHGRSPPQGQADILLKELLTSMTRQPSPGMRKRWSLDYIPPKHLRLPEYTYDEAEESESTDEVFAIRGRQSLLQRKLLTDQMTKVMSNMSLSQMDEEEHHTSDEAAALPVVAGDIEIACVNHQTPRPELLLPCSLLAFNDRGNNGFNGPLNDTNVL